VAHREIRSWLMDMDGVLVHEEAAIPAPIASSRAWESSRFRFSC
jgi:hypothetical protein